MLHLSQELLSELERQAEEAYPMECCGVLVGAREGEAKVVRRLVPALNQRTDSAHNRYLIDPRFLWELERRLRGEPVQILGFYHSHPEAEARPSSYDLEQAWPWYSYLIVSVRRRRAGEALSWVLREDRTAFDQEPLVCSRRPTAPVSTLKEES